MLMCQISMLFTDLIEELKHTSFHVAAFTDEKMAERTALCHLPSFHVLLGDNTEWQLHTYFILFLFFSSD